MAVRASTFKRYQKLTGSYHDENSRTLKYTKKGVGSSETDRGLKRNLGQMSLKITRKKPEPFNNVPSTAYLNVVSTGYLFCVCELSC